MSLEVHVSLCRNKTFENQFICCLFVNICSVHTVAGERTIICCQYIKHGSQLQKPRPDCMYDMEGVATFLRWPHPIVQDCNIAQKKLILYTSAFSQDLFSWQYMMETLDCSKSYLYEIGHVPKSLRLLVIHQNPK